MESPILRVAGHLVGLALFAACSGSPTEAPVPVEDLVPDGSHSVSLTNRARANSSNTPAWVLSHEPTIDFVKSNGSIVVTGSTNDVVNPNENVWTQVRNDGSFVVAFPVLPSVSGAVGSIWSVRLTESACIEAKAFGPGTTATEGIPMWCTLVGTELP